MNKGHFALACCLISIAATAEAEPLPTLAEVQALKAEIEAQAATLGQQRIRLQAMEDAILGQQRGTGTQAALAPPSPIGQSPAIPQPVPQGSVAQNGSDVPQPVGQAPSPREGQVEVAVLSEQGGIITRAGRLTIEPALEYARSDRNTVIFRGIQVPQSVLVGVFDINENRSDIVTASLAARYGITSRFEANVRVPFIYRSDISVLAPVTTGSGGNNSTSLPDAPAKGRNIGDIEFGARYQLTDGHRGFPFLIAGVQVVVPTGTNPFTLPRNPGTGVALASATGAGFYGVTPTITALLPTDPAVLFGTLGYTHNFARSFDGVQLATDVLVDRVRPGDAIQASAGIGISLNPRVALSLGYAQSLAFGTRTIGRAINRNNGVPSFTPFDSTTRDLQIGRLLFGVSYRTSESTTINWNVEVGATRDAADVRTTLRVPFSFGK